MKAQVLKTFDALGLYSLFSGATRNRAAVFMLHEILPDGEGTPQLFSSDRLDLFLGYLKSHQFRVISLREYVDAILARAPLYKTVVFTVDDGYADFYVNAYPVFKKYGYPASIFLTSDFIDGKLFFWWDQIEFALETTAKNSVDLGFIGQPAMPLESFQQRRQAISLITEAVKKVPNQTKLDLIAGLLKTLEIDISEQPTGKYRPLTWEEIHEMHQNRIDYFPHTKTHPILTRISRAEKQFELSESKARLEKELGEPMDIFCYPNGGPNDIDAETIEVLKTCGYRAAVTGIPGFDNSTGTVDPFLLRRFAIPNSLIQFKQLVCGLEAVKERIRG